MATICRRQSPIRAGLYTVYIMGWALRQLCCQCLWLKRNVPFSGPELCSSSSPASRVMTNKDSGHHPSCCGGWCSLFQPDFIYITYIWEKLRMFRYYISSVVVCSIIIRTMLYVVFCRDFFNRTQLFNLCFIYTQQYNGRTEQKLFVFFIFIKKLLSLIDAPINLSILFLLNM